MKTPKQNQSIPQQTYQREILEELGSKLRYLREQRQLSLTQIAYETRIAERTLKAIEEANLALLPEPVYIQCFVKRYAEVLGLEGSEFASPFPTYTPTRPLKASWVRLPTAQLRPVHLYLLYVVLIFCSVNGLSYMMNRSIKQARSHSYVEPPTVTVERTVYQSAQQPAVAPQRAQGSEDRVRVSLTFNAASWVRVEADGKTAFEGTLPEGTQKTWEAKQQLMIRAGNAGGVLVTLGNGQTRTLGEPGEVEEVTFRADRRSQM